MGKLKQVQPREYLYHKSNPKNRKEIQTHGLEPRLEERSEGFYSGKPAVFATNSNKVDDLFDTTYDDDIWQINPKGGNKWFADPYFSDPESKDPTVYYHVLTFEHISPEYLSLAYEGTGADILDEGNNYYKNKNLKLAQIKSILIKLNNNILDMTNPVDATMNRSDALQAELDKIKEEANNPYADKRQLAERAQEIILEHEILTRDLESLGSIKATLIKLNGYDEEAYNSANQYLQKSGLPALQYHEPVKSDPVRGKEIAKAYEAMKHEPENPEVIKAYRQFAKEVENQWEHLPVKVEFTDGDPYKNSKEMFQDILQNKRLKVFRGGKPHGFLSAKDSNGISVNEKFRAVHDYFGHFMAKYQFGASGEQNAYLEHAKMFSPLARKVMATETMGQNNWFNYSDANEGKHPKERQFAEQKAGFLPEEYLK